MRPEDLLYCTAGIHIRATSVYFSFRTASILFPRYARVLLLIDPCAHFLEAEKEYYRHLDTTRVRRLARESEPLSRADRTIMISDGLADPMHKIASSHATTALSQRRDDFHSPGIARPCHRSHSQIPLFRFLVTAVLVVPTLAQSCISLAASTQCPAFNASSISLDRSLTELYPFLGQVSDVASFDSGIQSYVAGDFTQRR